MDKKEGGRPVKTQAAIATSSTSSKQAVLPSVETADASESVENARSPRLNKNSLTVLLKAAYDAPKLLAILPHPRSIDCGSTTIAYRLHHTWVRRRSQFPRTTPQTALAMQEDKSSSTMFRSMRDDIDTWARIATNVLLVATLTVSRVSSSGCRDTGATQRTYLKPRCNTAVRFACLQGQTVL